MPKLAKNPYFWGKNPSGMQFCKCSGGHGFCDTFFEGCQEDGRGVSGAGISMG
jgi:hypothetical protein